MGPEATDMELLRAWSEGDKVAGNRLFRRHFDALFRFLATKVDGPCDDLVQQAFEGCLRSAGAFEGRSSFRTYLLRIARNHLCDYYRARGPEFSADEHSVVDAGASPSGQLFEHQRSARLLAALRRLPLDFQITLELFYWEGLKTEEIGVVLGVSPHTARSRLARGRERLRDLMARLDVVADDELATLERNADFDAWARDLRPTRS